MSISQLKNKEMIEIKIKDATLQQAAQEGLDALYKFLLTLLTRQLADNSPKRICKNSRPTK